MPNTKLPNATRSVRRAPHWRVSPALTSIFIGWAGFIALAGLTALIGCKPVGIDAPANDTTVKADSATLRVTNHIEQDPGTITMVLFPGNSIDIINANRTKELGTVGEGAVKTFKVPAGSWKLAYAKAAGDLHAMIDESDGAQEWVKAIFAKNGSYSLELATDGNYTVWIPTFTTDPAGQ